ncbi:hypothetical protein [Nonomuraea sp. NPDC050310]|uniref:hypothetical protein n=1 Tax=Nonomuraea sp. NPDC050310 TaxID=3154935 RepID=UPI0033FE9DC3
MTGRLRRAWDDLRGASGASFVALASAQIATARAGAVLAVGPGAGRPGLGHRLRPGRAQGRQPGAPALDPLDLEETMR